MRPRLLDLFCKAGGASVGYHRAGFDVVGVDIEPQPNYPYEFHQADAMTYPLDGFDAFHGSPPCQLYSAMNRGRDFTYPDLVDPTRQRLLATGRPFAIENVEGAPLLNALTICGTMVGVRVRRHRLFEIHPLPAVLLPPCTCRNGVINGSLVGHREGGRVAPGRTRPPSYSREERKAALGIDWYMTGDEVRNTIPPAYTEFVGALLLDALA